MAFPYQDQQQQHLLAQNYYQSVSPTYPRYISNATLAAGGLGAVIGATAAAAKDIQRIGNDEMTRQDAVKDVIKEAAGTGLAVAAATAVVRATGARGLLSLLGIVAVATGTKYAWNSFAGTEQ
jgi:uncharacterized protein (UPF0335 family)